MFYTFFKKQYYYCISDIYLKSSKMYCGKIFFSRQIQQIASISVFSLKHSVHQCQDKLRHLDNPKSDEEEIVRHVCKGDSEQEKKLKTLILKVEMLRQKQYARIPDSLQIKHWEKLLKPSNSGRLKYLAYLSKTQKLKETRKVKKELQRKEQIEDGREFPDDLHYGMYLKGPKLFLQIRESSMNKFYTYRVLQAMMHSPLIVFDCSYEEHMVSREKVNIVHQISHIWGVNRIHQNPFCIHLCNVNKAGEFMKQLVKSIPTLKEPWFPMNIHTNSYLDIFPKDKLVYLTPHCNEELSHYDPNAIYIIGCFLDKTNKQPLSLIKAQNEEVKTAKLPLKTHVQLKQGAGLALNIDHITSIMLDLKMTDNWDFALRHVPKRKLVDKKIRTVEC